MIKSLVQTAGKANEVEAVDDAPTACPAAAPEPVSAGGRDPDDCSVASEADGGGPVKAVPSLSAFGESGGSGCRQARSPMMRVVAPGGVAEDSGTSAAVAEGELNEGEVEDDEIEAMLRETLKNDGGREVENDYPRPKWIKSAKWEYEYPYEYNKAFVGRHGVINYDLVGPEGGPIIITLHGLNGSKSTFRRVEEALSRYGFRILSFDFYGHGLSACPPYKVCGDTYSLEFYVSQVVEIVEHLHLDTACFNLIGFSLGCVVAAGVAARLAAQVLRVVLISPAGMLNSVPKRVKCLRCCQCCIPVFPLCVCRCCCMDKSKFMKRFFSEQDIIDGEAEAFWNRLMFHLFIKGGVVSAFLGTVSRMPLWSAEDLFKQVGKFGFPTLVLWGSEDEVVHVADSENVVACFKNAHLIVFPGATHQVLSEKMVPVIASILTFMELPEDCDLGIWNFFLPFSPDGAYVPTYKRCPPGMTVEEFQDQAGYVALHHFRARNEKPPPPAESNIADSECAAATPFQPEEPQNASLSQETLNE